ncbi:MAG: phytanoyl-CoA dioxygenase family protein [Pirellulales bacterium]|nr:phytanoyl-CoA dioxygenase family protein [Pirellulales bacterium]
MQTELPADNTHPLTAEQVEQFQLDGYLAVENLFDAEELGMMLQVAKEDRLLHEHAYGRKDSQGRESRLSLWNHPGDDLFGIVSRSRRIVDAMEQLLGGEVYHYHSKLMLKEPLVGGAWEWHQDYGYWYQNGCLYPWMASCLIALDRATRANGCLQVLKGSHHMGRVEHGRFGDQTGADPERVRAAIERLEHVYCEMAPGTGLFFHGNLLHASDANTSPDSRWSLICCYNAASNDPYKDSHHPRYTPLKKVPDSAIKQTGAAVSSAGKAFLDPVTNT